MAICVITNWPVIHFSCIEFSVLLEDVLSVRLVGMTLRASFIARCCQCVMRTGPGGRIRHRGVYWESKLLAETKLNTDLTLTEMRT
jgi:hypothetical protein